MMQPRSVLIVGSEESRVRIKRYVDSLTYHVVGEMSNVSGLHLVARLAPDMIVIDGTAAMVNPLVVLPALAALPHAPQIIALSATDSSAERLLWLELGAAAVAQLARPDTLASALRQLARGSNRATHASKPRATPRQRARHLAALWRHNRAA